LARTEKNRTDQSKTEKEKTREKPGKVVWGEPPREHMFDYFSADYLSVLSVSISLHRYLCIIIIALTWIML
jgi:hypothetical protein